MAKLQSVEECEETFTGAWLANAEDETNPGFIAPTPGAAGAEPDDYARVQRQFGWDDTH